MGLGRAEALKVGDAVDVEERVDVVVGIGELVRVTVNVALGERVGGELDVREGLGERVGSELDVREGLGERVGSELDVREGLGERVGSELDVREGLGDGVGVRATIAVKLRVKLGVDDAGGSVELAARVADAVGVAVPTSWVVGVGLGIATVTCPSLVRQLTVPASVSRRQP